MISLGRSAGPASNTQLEAWNVDFDELAESLKSPEVGKKDGSYFVRGPTNGTSTRANSNITEAHLIILDGDSMVDPETGEVVSGAPGAELVHEVLVDIDVAHIIYTSHSHQADGKGNRYRVLVRPNRPIKDQAELKCCVDWLVDQLDVAGVPLANVKENYAWAQAWFFPRLRSPDAPFEFYEHDGGEYLNVDDIQPPAPKPQSKQYDPNSPIGRFNSEHGSPDKMLELLQAHGYILKYQPSGDECRLVSPTSTSGMAGVRLYRGEDGRWFVYSHHGENDPLADGHAHDAYDLHQIFNPTQTSQIVKIAVKKGAVGAMTRQAIAAIKNRGVYQRSGGLVKLTTEKKIEGYTIDAMEYLLNTEIQWIKYDNTGEGFPADAPVKVARSILVGDQDWEGIPVLAGISDCPIVHKDGSVRDKEGYDAASKLYCTGNFPPPKPGGDIKSPFSEFPFVSETDFSVVLAYLFTLLMRQQLPLAPLFGFSSTVPGTGKGLLVEVCNMIVRGTDAAIMAPPAGGSKDDETRKRITSLLACGYTSILIDNWTSPVAGDSINTLMTSSTWSDRVLGQSKVTSLPSTVTWAATGNNLTVRGDMVRRSVICRLDPCVERPEKRVFKDNRLLTTVQDNRGALLAHLISIMRDYLKAGMPGADDVLLGRFEEWSRIVGGCVRWMGYPDPTQSQAVLAVDDSEASRLDCLLSAWYAVFSDKWVRPSAVVSRAMEAMGDRSDIGQRLTDLRDALSDIAEDSRGGISTKKLGWFLGHFLGRQKSGLVFQKNTTVKRALYRVIEQEPTKPT